MKRYAHGRVEEHNGKTMKHKETNHKRRCISIINIDIETNHGRKIE